MTLLTNPLYANLFKGGAFLLDNTGMETITTCPRRAYWYLVRKRETDGKREALNFGSGFHEAMAHRYRDSSRYCDPSLRESSIGVALKWFETNPQPDDAWRTADLCARVVDKYLVENMSDVFEVQVDQNGPVVERAFAVPLGVITTRLGCEIPIVWTGKLDLIVKLDGRRAIVDHKTTSMLGTQYFEQFKLSGQFTGYEWANRQSGGEPCQGVVINTAAVRRPTKTGTPIEFAREFLPIAQWQIDQWQNNTLNIIATFLDMCENGYHPMHSAYCVNKFGKCEYHDVCTLKPNEQEILIKSRLYKDVTWSPLND